MTERTRLISYLLYGVFSAGKKPEAFSNIRLRAQEVIRGHVHWTEKIETRGDSRNSFFENETIFVFITPRSWANLALKNEIHNARSLEENNARSAANQSARTTVAI